jgi:bifunctional DNA primase/polymerase-like protein
VNNLREALELAGGIPVFPCRADKRPYTERGFKDASTDPALIQEWWKQWPDALVGVPTGEFSGLYVIDIDSARHDEANDWFERHAPFLLETRQHQTKSGGWHLLFQHRDGLRNTAGKLAKGVDTRGDGGYVIFWAAHGFDVLNADVIAELPSWISAELNPPPRTPTTTTRRPLRTDNDLKPLVRVILQAKEGERNTATFWASCRLAEHVRDGQISRADMIGIVGEAAGRTGLSHHEAKTIARSALRAVGAA